VSVTVTDNLGNSGSKVFSVSYVPGCPTSAPIVVSTSDVSYSGLGAQSITGSATWSDNQAWASTWVVSWSWNGDVQQGLSGHSDSDVFTFGGNTVSPGTSFPVTVTVTDNMGCSGSATFNVIYVPLAPLTVFASDISYSGFGVQNISNSASWSDPNIGVSSWTASWSWTNDIHPVYSTGDSDNLVSDLEGGPFQVTVTVTDSVGASGSATFNVNYTGNSGDGNNAMTTPQFSQVVWAVLGAAPGAAPSVADFAGVQTTAVNFFQPLLLSLTPAIEASPSSSAADSLRGEAAASACVAAKMATNGGATPLVAAALGRENVLAADYLFFLENNPLDPIVGVPIGSMA
jgi:hypothetical protein